MAKRVNREVREVAEHVLRMLNARYDAKEEPIDGQALREAYRSRSRKPSREIDGLFSQATAYLERTGDIRESGFRAEITEQGRRRVVKLDKKSGWGRWVFVAVGLLVLWQVWTGGREADTGVGVTGGGAGVNGQVAGAEWYITPYEGHADFQAGAVVVMRYAQCSAVHQRMPVNESEPACTASWPGERFRVLDGRPVWYFSQNDGRGAYYWYVTSLDRRCTGWISEIKRTEEGHVALCLEWDRLCELYADGQRFFPNADNRPKGTFSPEYCAKN